MSDISMQSNPHKSSKSQIFKILNCGSFFQRLEVRLHDADIVRGPDLLELLAGRCLVAGHVVDGADCDSSAFSGSDLEGEMRAAFSGGLEDHALRVGGIDAAIFSDAGRVDDEDIKVKAASSTAKAEHAAK